MRVMVLGAAGMLGSRLIAEIRSSGIDGRRVDDLVGVDTDEAPDCDRALRGDLADRDFVDLAAGLAPDVVFHLAAVVSGQAEAEHGLGYDVNVHGTWHLLEAMRAAPDWHPRFVFASSIAVFGSPLPEVIGDDHRTSPRTSYGTQKAIAELLISDYTRRGFLDGVSVRLPTVVVRPGRPNRAASGFFSSIIREPLAGRSATVPVRRDLVHWIAGPDTVVAQLLHAAALPAERLGAERTLTMPGLGVSVAEIIAAVERFGGPSVIDLITDEPDPAIEAMVETWPARFDTARAGALAFPADLGIDDLVRRHMATVADELRTDGDDVTGMSFGRRVSESLEDRTGASQAMTHENDTAGRVIAKIRLFIETLDDAERQVFAAMLAPAVAEAWATEPEVEGFGATWTPTRVQDHLNRSIRQQRFRIEIADDA